MFTEEYRKQVHDRVLELAAEDARVVASAVVGSLAVSDADRRSDLDLTFAVADQFVSADVLADWTGKLIREMWLISRTILPLNV